MSRERALGEAFPERLKTKAEALEAVIRNWPRIVEECREVLGSELHYQAVVYHCLRIASIPPWQLGMNVKMYITDVVSEYFKVLDLKKHEDFRGGFEPIPDLVIFAPEIGGDFRRRNCTETLRHMLLAVEIKASERSQSRLSAGEIVKDILKLKAQLEEAQYRGGDFAPIMMIVDTAPDENERMRPWALEQIKVEASQHKVHLFYLSPIIQFYEPPEQ